MTALVAPWRSCGIQPSRRLGFVLLALLVAADAAVSAVPWPTGLRLALAPGPLVERLEEEKPGSQWWSVWVGGQFAGSCRLARGRLVCFRAVLLPPALAEADVRRGGATATELALTARRVAAELWPDFAASLTSVAGAVTVLESSGQPPIATVRVASTPHPRLRLAATVCLLAWSGEVVSFERSEACPLPVELPVAPRIGEEQAVGIGATLAKRAAAGRAVAFKGAVLTCPDGVLQWSVGFCANWAEGGDGRSERWWSVEIDATSGAVLHSGPWLDLGPLTEAMTGAESGAPEADGHGAPGTRPTEDSAPAYAPSTGLLFVSQRRRSGTPWWREWNPAACMVTNAGLSWVATGRQTGVQKAAAAGGRLFLWTGGSLQSVALATGQVQERQGCAGVGVSASGDSVWIAERRGPPDPYALVRIDAASLAAVGPPLAYHRERPMHLAVSPNGEWLAYVLNGNVLCLHNLSAKQRSQQQKWARPILGLCWQPSGQALLLETTGPDEPADAPIQPQLRWLDGRVEDVAVPAAVRALGPRQLTYGASAADIVFVGRAQAGAKTGRRLHHWQTVTGEVRCLVSADAPSPDPYVFANGRSALDLVAAVEQANWRAVREAYRRFYDWAP